ncbi:MAG: hypothetical protein DWQ05_01510 [Calditrichaeota bacterium]|nr:MAG: hypothetical protein DWQ05_01510 [Calditrichota bacterium]
MGIICTDAGHGGTDSGAAWGNMLEKNLNLAYTLSLNTELRKRGHLVFTTREKDVTFPLGTRCKLVNSHHRDKQPEFDAIISLHCNVAAKKDPQTGKYIAYADRRGFYAIYSEESANSTKLAQSIADQVKINGIPRKHEGMLSTIALGRTLAWIHKTVPPATLLELGFMTNPQELADLRDPAYLKVMVKSVADGVENFIK